MKGGTLALTKGLLETASKLFYARREYKIADSAIRHALNQFPDNKNSTGVYVKSVLINTLYRTGIMDIIRMAHHILDKNIDRKLRTADITVINDIRYGHRIESARGEKKEIDFYCFATKYVHFHVPRSYPIYDNLVMRFLTESNRIMDFHKRFAQAQLKDYRTYKSVVDSLAQSLYVVDWSYKKIDQGLWILAKYRYHQDELPQEIVQELKDIR